MLVSCEFLTADGHGVVEEGRDDAVGPAADSGGGGDGEGGGLAGACNDNDRNGLGHGTEGVGLGMVNG